MCGTVSDFRIDSGHSGATVADFHRSSCTCGRDNIKLFRILFRQVEKQTQADWKTQANTPYFSLQFSQATIDSHLRKTRQLMNRCEFVCTPRHKSRHYMAETELNIIAGAFSIDNYSERRVMRFTLPVSSTTL